MCFRLDIIQVAVLDPLNMEYLRIDGSITIDVRTKRIEEFKTSSKISILLMTTKGVYIH
jgi:SNF2 family DNA or RNA helicase